VSRTLKNVVFAASGLLVAQFLGSLRSFVLARLIEPADYGIWTGAQTVASLSPIVCLGTVEALLKRVPFFRGRGDAEGLRKVESSVLGTIILAAAALAILFLGFPGLVPSHFVHENLTVVQLTAIAAGISFFGAFYYQRLAAYENFKAAGFVDSVRSVISAVCVLAFAWRWGLLGGVVGGLLSEILGGVACGLVSRKAHGPVRPSFQPGLMADAVRVGFPITIIWWIYIIHANVGRITAVSFLGNTQTGYYGVGSAMAVIFALVPNTIGRVFYPRVNAQVGANASLGDLRASVVVPTAALALVLPVAQLLVFYLLPFVYEGFLPKYREGLTCAQILILGAFFVGLIRNGANYLIAIDQQLRLMKYVAISVVANGAGSVVLASLGYGINGIAAATSLASALLALLIWNRVFVELQYVHASRVSTMLNICLPFAGLVFAVGLIHVGTQGVGHSNLLLSLQMIAAVCIYAAVIMVFPTTRAHARDLGRRALKLVNGRVKPAF
jgi:O-antigen/teichoic acid export membrane protein